MYKDIERFKLEAGWDGASGQSRQKLLGQLQGLPVSRGAVFRNFACSV